MKPKVFKRFSLDLDYHPTKFSLDIIAEKIIFVILFSQYKYNVENIKDNEKYRKATEELTPENWSQLRLEFQQTAENVAHKTRARKHA